MSSGLVAQLRTEALDNEKRFASDAEQNRSVLRAFLDSL